MTKSLLITQSSSRMVNVLNELTKYLVVKKVNKDVLEKLERGETVEAYLYCTKGKPLLGYEIVDYDDSWGYPATDGGYSIQNHIDDFDQLQGSILNGTIPVKVVIDGYEKITPRSYSYLTYDGMEYVVDYKISKEVIEQSCLTYAQFEEYGEDKHGELGYLYALHISKVEVFDKPMILMQLHEKDVDIKCGTLKNDEETIRCYEEHRITKAPQNMMSVWVK